MARTLILGGGFGGISAATELRGLLGDDHQIVLVDRRPRFSMGLRKLWELVGIGTIADGSRERRLLGEQGIEVVEEEIVSIDPVARSAASARSEWTSDHLVVALGADARPDLVPGLVEHGHEVWTGPGARRAAEALARFEGGRIVVLVAGAPYPCPPAPYECLFHVHEHLRRRGLRETTELTGITLQPMLMPNAGREGSDWMAEQLAARDIGARTGARVERVEEGRAVFADGEEAFDLLFAVPPHRPPEVVERSGLLGDHGWVAVDAGTLATSYAGVYAIGDVTLIPLANGLPLPKAGIMAEAHGRRVARAIAAEIRGEPEPEPFDGSGFCPVEIGADTAALVQGRWYETPEPVVELVGPSEELVDAKRGFERERLERWFGG